LANTAYVGKIGPNGFWRPGRIQTTTAAGIYAIEKGTETLFQNNSFYLANNPSYTYSWVSFSGALPTNAVKVRNPVGSMAFAVTRLPRIYNETRIGMFMGKEAYFPNANGIAGFYNTYEVLTCNPVPPTTQAPTTTPASDAGFYPCGEFY
jgi:hypothetical protein